MSPGRALNESFGFVHKRQIYLESCLNSKFDSGPQSRVEQFRDEALQTGAANVTSAESPPFRIQFIFVAFLILSSAPTFNYAWAIATN